MVWFEQKIVLAYLNKFTIFLSLLKGDEPVADKKKLNPKKIKNCSNEKLFGWDVDFKFCIGKSVINSVTW